MKQSIDYASVLDFSGLPAVREILRRKEPGFKITNLSPLDISTAHTDTARQNAAQSLHKVANAVFNNLSHGLELPWEKYLSEMHEFAAPSRSNLQIFGASDIIPNDWSTLVSLSRQSHFHYALTIDALGTDPSSQHRSPKRRTRTVRDGSGCLQ